MFWADAVAQKIVETGKFVPYHVDDMFTPSGFAHIGSLRGPLVHDIVYRALLDRGVDVTFTFVLNDFDPVDGLPPELMSLSSELGKPLRLARAPDNAETTFAEYFTNDFKKVLTSLGVSATFLSSWDMYHAGKFDVVIREALDHADLIQDIYQRVSGSKKREKGWLPLQVVCENCGRLGTTRVHGWDGTTVSYTCEPDMVSWAKGCGYNGKTSPFTDSGDPKHHPGKLPWKVDWPAHWKVMGVTIEGAGKDHSSAGGSRDIARELCREVFHIPEPYNLPYEFFLIGGKKMSSSKGLGLKARDLTKVLPAPVGKFLFTRTDYRQAIEIDPTGTMAIPDLFDEYDRCWTAYHTDGDENLSRAFLLSQIHEPPAKNPEMFLPRFRDIANYIQLPNVDLLQKFECVKGLRLTEAEVRCLGERETYARVWVSRFAPDDYKYQLSVKPYENLSLSDIQWDFLRKLAVVWKYAEDPEKLQSELFRLVKEMHLDPKLAFEALYCSVLDKPYGPRAGWLLRKFPKDAVIGRLTLAPKIQVTVREKNVHGIHKPDYFVIDPKVKERYPTVSIGIALIRGVRIAPSDRGLEEEKKKFLNGLAGLTTEELGKYPEIISYRKLYRDMGIDWHSRRPSPEALLRRVALGKGLYTVNTCVDAYNLVVMSHRVSIGAFNADMVQFPAVLRYAGAGDEILLLGDTEPTAYKATELAYYDRVGGYNIDFNYRDAKRTMVTEDTKDIWINVDGILDIAPDMVEHSLNESVQNILRYCGGTLDFTGVVT
ncbi:lysine--tRNA ligase [Patescibacteria group bacterium]|nr:lysine--tRNA ligase [Patescibacteria group bacterium]